MQFSSLFQGNAMKDIWEIVDCPVSPKFVGFQSQPPTFLKQ